MCPAGTPPTCLRPSYSPGPCGCGALSAAQVMAIAPQVLAMRWEHVCQPLPLSCSAYSPQVCLTAQCGHVLEGMYKNPGQCRPNARGYGKTPLQYSDRVGISLPLAVLRVIEVSRRPTTSILEPVSCPDGLHGCVGTRVVCASRPVPSAARPSACGLVARACGGVAVTFRPRLGRTVPYTPVSKILVRALKTSWVALPAVAASVWIPYTRISLFQAAVHKTGEQTAAKPAACLPAARPAAGPSVSCSNPPPVPTTCSACCRSGCQLPGPTKRAAEGGWHAFPPTCSCPLQATLTPLGAACA